MFEILIVCAAVLFALGLLVFVAKLVLTVILLPIHIGLFIVQGLLFLFIGVPVVIAFIGVAALALPVLIVVGLPILVLVGSVFVLVKLLT